jgi:hypothetical protein
MGRENSGERTARLLSQRLEDLAETLERSGASTKAVARLLELASVATLHAVQLELLTADRAGRIWQGAEQRHPVLEGRDARLTERHRARARAAT